MAESQQQTIINLYNSGISPEIIAFQLDISPEDVDRVIQSTHEMDRTSKQTPEAGLLASFYLDAVVDLDKAIKMAQQRVWKALKVESKFDISTEETHEILSKYSKSKVMLAILHIDL